MKIAIGCDPNAQQAKEDLIKFMEDKGYGEIKDFGSEDPIYANTAVAVAEAVASGEYDRGILICGTGAGISLAANKVNGIRAVVCSDPYTARMAKEHNNANVIAFGARVIGIETAKCIVDAWLNAKFEGGRHATRVDMIMDVEKRNHNL